MSVVDEVRQRTDIVELIGSYVQLQRSGRNYKALCPFHTEKTPSFVVFPDSQRWHCFGACGTGGDAFSFVMRHDNLEFGEALRLLARRAGVELEPVSPLVLEEREGRDLLRAINAAAATYYHRVLLDADAAEPARAYVERRGLTRETIATFQLGYALDEWHAAHHHLRRDYTDEDLLKAGILTQNERGDTYDRFRGRVMFPIRDAQGHVIGFGGRVLDDSEPKYLNSPDSALFHKGSVLYGIDLTHRSIREQGTAVVVEGYMDVIGPYQCGVTNLVACLGTALSEEHVRTLQRLSRRIVLALDPDAAGMRATERGIETARQVLEARAVPVPTARGLIRFETEFDTEIRVLALPDERDPDELVLEDRSLWDELVAGAKPVAEYLFDIVLAEEDVSTAAGKRAAVDRLLPVIATMGRAVERAHYLQVLARHVRMDERRLLPEMERVRRRGRPRRPERSSAEPQARVRPAGELTPAEMGLEGRIVALLYRQPALLAELLEVVDLEPDAFADARNVQAYRALRERRGLPAEEAAAQALASLDTSLRGHVESLLRSLGEDPSFPLQAGHEEIAKSAIRLRQEYLSRSLNELRFMLEDAQEEGHQERVREILAQIDRITREYRELHRRLYAVSLVGRTRRETGFS